MSDDIESSGFPQAVTRLRWLRGAYLDQVVVLEGVLDAYLFEYLAPPEAHRTLFYGVVLQRIGLNAKVQIMIDFVRDAGLAEEFGDIAVSLNAIVQFRNQCAHAHLQPKVSEDLWSAEEASIVTWKKGELRTVPITQAEFEQRLDDVPKVFHRLWEFMCRVATARETTE